MYNKRSVGAMAIFAIAVLIIGGTAFYLTKRGSFSQKVEPDLSQSRSISAKDLADYFNVSEYCDYEHTRSQGAVCFTDKFQEVTTAEGGLVSQYIPDFELVDFTGDGRLDAIVTMREIGSGSFRHFHALTMDPSIANITQLAEVYRDNGFGIAYGTSKPYYQNGIIVLSPPRSLNDEKFIPGKIISWDSEMKRFVEGPVSSFFDKANRGPKVISCNPREYNSTYFKKEKPCVSDMTAVDIEIENEALSIIEKASADDRGKYCSLPYLYVSDKRYPVISTNCAPASGYVVVDLTSEKVTDFFTLVGWRGVERTSRRIIFIEPIISNQQTVGEKVHWFVFGTEKSKSAADSELHWPYTYLHVDSSMGFGSANIIASNESSITLGIHDRNKSSVQGDSMVYEQTGTKVVSF